MGAEPVEIRLARPASANVPEQVYSIDLDDASADTAINPVYRVGVTRSEDS